MGGSRDVEDPVAGGLDVLADDVGQILCIGHIDLVEGHEGGPFGQRQQVACGAVVSGGDVDLVGGEFGFDGRKVADRVAVGLPGGHVDDVDEDCAAFDVAEELVAETAALCGAGNEPGHIGDRVAGVACLHDAEVGHECGEGVVGDLRLGCREGGDEAGLPGRRVADEGDVGDGLDFEDEVAGLAGFAEQGEAGCLALLGGKGCVSESAAAAGGGDEPGARLDKVGQQGAISGFHDRAGGHGQNEVLTVGAMPQVAFADPTAGGAAVR